MGTLFPNDPEFPDHHPLPSLFVEAARQGLLPLLIMTLLAEAGAPLIESAIEREPKRAALATWQLTPTNFAKPVHGTDSETGDATPHARRPVVTSTTTSDPALPPFGGFDSNDVVLMHHRALRDAHHRAYYGTQPTWNPALFTAVRPRDDDEGPENETGDPTPHSRTPLTVSSTSGNVNIEVPAGRLSIFGQAPTIKIAPSSATSS